MYSRTQRALAVGVSVIGKNKGIDIRNKINLENIEKQNCKIKIIIPNNIFSFNSSCFSGLFENSIKNLGKKEFLKKYKFITNSKTIKLNIADGINDIIENIKYKGI